MVTVAQNSVGERIRRMGLIMALACMAGLVLVACGGGGGGGGSTGNPAGSQPTATAPSGSTGGTGGGGAAQEVQVTLKEWAIEPKTLEVNAGKVRFDVTNSGQFTHDFVILKDGNELAKTPTFRQADGTQVLEVDLQPGTYKVLCDIQGHADRGMQGELIVK